MSLKRIILLSLSIVLLHHEVFSFQSQQPFSIGRHSLAIHDGTRTFETIKNVNSITKPYIQSRQTSFSPSNPSSSTELHMSPILTTLASSPLGAISVLAGIVVVHEAGHYSAAKFFNVTVEEFAVGFGPKLFGFSAFGNEFNLRALPLGGYVRFPENYDGEKAFEMEQKAREAFRQRREEEGWTASENIINLLTFGRWDERRRQQRKDEEAKLAAEKAAKKPWFLKAFAGPEGESAVAKKSDDPEDFEVEYSDDPDLLQNRPWTQRAVVLSMGVIFNMILAFSLYFGEIRLGTGLPEPMFESGVVVSASPNKNGPSDNLLRKNDLIVGVNGNPLLIDKNTPLDAQKQVTEVISSIRSTPDGQSVKLSVKRANVADPVDVTVTPERTTKMAPKTIGVLLSPNFKSIVKLQSDDTFEALKLSWGFFINIVDQTFLGLVNIVSMMLSGSGSSAGQSVTGPIGLIKAGTEVVSKQDLTAVLVFAAALSINLGVINALPLPALDGGQLLFVLAEAITGRKVDQKLQEGISSVAVLLLLLVTISTAVSDVGSIVNGR